MQKTVSKTQGVFLLLFANVMWGLSFIFSKTALADGIPTMTLAFLRYAMTAAIMVPLCLYQDGGIRLHRWAPLCFLTAMLGITVYYFFEYSGLQYTTASAASLILSLVPMMTLLYRVIVCRERISALRWGCVLMSLAGVYLVIRSGNAECSGTILGNLLMICACLCWTAYILISKPLMQSCSSIRVTTWQALAAVVTLAPFAVAEHSSWVPISMKSWLCIFLLAAVCSALCYVIYAIALRSVDSLTVSLSININPIVACIAGALMLGESLTLTQWSGGVMIMIAVLLDSLEESGFLKKKQA